MSSIQLLHDVTVYNSITALSGVHTNALFVGGPVSFSDLTTLKNSSANWDSTYSTVKSSSGSWGVGGTSDITVLAESSGRWNSSYSALTANSASWNDAYTNLQSNSSFYLNTLDTTKLPLSGGLMNGAIRFGDAFGARIDQGYYDSSRSGLSGISLVCSVDYDFNWQAGWITALQQDRSTPMPLYIDSGVGTSLRVWNGTSVGSGSGVEITHSGIVFSDGTTQNTAGLPLSGGVIDGDLTVTGSFSTVDTDGWKSNYTTTNTNSARWESAYTTVQSNSTNPTFETLTVTSSATLNGVVGIGTTAPDPSKALYVVGDVLVYGNLSANGTMSFTNTLFTTTSSLSVYNSGTGPALVVAQEGDQPVAAFYDHTASGIALWVDGAADRPGWIGVKTETPNKELTVVGDISATGKIYSTNTINKFVSAFGDGSSVSYTITHNLETYAVVSCVYDNSTMEVVYPSVLLSTPNSITVEFTTAPGNSAYTITVIG